MGWGANFTGIQAERDVEFAAINQNMSYPVAVLTHAIWVARKIPEMATQGKGLEQNEVYASFAAIRGFGSLVRAGIYPQFKKDFDIKYQEYLDKFNIENIMPRHGQTIIIKREKFLKDAYDFYDFICNNFGRAGVLPPIEEDDTDLSTQEQLRDKEYDKILKAALILVKKVGAQRLEKILVEEKEFQKQNTSDWEQQDEEEFVRLDETTGV